MSGWGRTLRQERPFLADALVRPKPDISIGRARHRGATLTLRSVIRLMQRAELATIERRDAGARVMMLRR